LPAFELAKPHPIGASAVELSILMSSQLAALNQWVDSVAQLTQPQAIHWCDGSDSEYQALVDGMLVTGDLLALNPETHPRSYLHRSHPGDVARVEHLTYVCTAEREDAGPNNPWMAPAEAHAKMDALFAGCMRGRTLYVVPYCMGPIDSPLARCGVEITDSAYVAANMRIMTRSVKEPSFVDCIQLASWIRNVVSSCISRPS